MKVTVKGKFPTLNDYIDKCRARNKGYILGAEMKKKSQHKCVQAIQKQLGEVRCERRIWVDFVFYEENRRRDMDNVSGFFHKVFMDALKESGVIVDDGWKYVKGYSDRFEIDAKNPRIEVTIEEE